MRGSGRRPAEGANVLFGITDHDIHHGTIIRTTLESSSNGHNACSNESSRGITCVDAREAFWNASEVNMIWMRYNDDWNTRTPDTLYSHWLVASLSSAVCATAREIKKQMSE